MIDEGIRLCGSEFYVAWYPKTSRFMTLLLPQGIKPSLEPNADTSVLDSVGADNFAMWNLAPLLIPGSVSQNKPIYDTKCADLWHYCSHKEFNLV